MNGLLKWAASNGAYISPLASFSKDLIRGVYSNANSDIPQNSTIFKIPTKLLITSSQARAHFGMYDSKGPALTHLYLAKMKFASLDCSEASFYAPYLDYLDPDGFKIASTPLLWTEKELQIILDSELGSLASSRLSQLQSEWRSILGLVSPECPELKEINPSSTAITSWRSFGAYVWAANVFYSRGFPEVLIAKDPDAKNRAFILPVVDLLNHSGDAHVRWEYSDDFVTFTTVSGIIKNQEIANDYGLRSVADTILSYGYFPRENDAEGHVTILLKVDALGLQLARGVGLQLDSENVQFTISKTVPSQMIRFFAALNQLRSETGKFTVRMQLYGLQSARAKINEAIQNKKSKLKGGLKNLRPQVAAICKEYLKFEIRLLQNGVDELQAKEKAVLKKYKPILAKKLFKMDSFDAIDVQKYPEQALAVYVAYAVKGKAKNAPSFVVSHYKDIEESGVIDAEDMEEERENYRAFGKGLDVSLKEYTIATVVVDRIEYLREASGELYLVDGIID